jgi:hypothetical protein
MEDGEDPDFSADDALTDIDNTSSATAPIFHPRDPPKTTPNFRMPPQDWAGEWQNMVRLHANCAYKKQVRSPAESLYHPYVSKTSLSARQ